MAKKITKIIAIVLAAVILAAILGSLLFVSHLRHSSGYVNFDRDKLNQVCAAVTLLDDNGQEIKESLPSQNGKQIPLSALNKYTYMAFVAVEDKRFFSHSGLDYKRILGALAHNVAGGGFKEGASTISQQLIKNTHLNNSKNLNRKVNEMLLAIELENAYSKQEILEMYLNTIYFGRSAYGIETAANVYFDKSAAELSVAESAMLAGMIKAPNTYAPDKDAEKCKQRRDTVLKLMAEQKVIDQTQYREALEEEIYFAPYHARREKTYTEKVIEEACLLLNMTRKQLLDSGFIIETYCDQNVLSALYKHAKQDETLNNDGTLADLSCVVCRQDGGVAACYFRGENAEMSKQIGSTAKPIAVYTPALCEKLISQASPVLDEPTDFGGYKPANAGGYNGWTTVKNAVVKSLNVPAVKTLNTLGLNKAQKYLQKLGFTGEQNLSLALGNVNGGMTPQELTACYNTLQNGGTKNELTYIKHIYSEKGEIYSRTVKQTQVYDAKSAYLMTDMLCEAAKSGTAKRLASANVTVAAKTGTVGNSKGNSEAILAGYTTEHTFVFWYSGNLPNAINGATSPCYLATNVLADMYKYGKPSPFLPPEGTTRLTVDISSLYRDQLVKISDVGETFWFDTANTPNAHLVNCDPR
ncbi:MAG: transglycosylase domain-containing protein [Corallococcus sp.]|nr:transglycosylase domain-containing protein [Corallococcus sp.]MCM1359175.1 transglycosylase domain-containing protein [Corallococcus sp.]MCM1394565.1 transglycosylase domain-containing protein [Corallococcus sp.]